MALKGRDVFPALDARTRELRRLRRCVEAHIADLGGAENISHAERVLIGRAGMLTALIEVQERKFANQNLKARPEDLDSYQRVVSCLRRVFETLGLQRRTRDVTPLSVDEWKRQKLADKYDEEEGDIAAAE